MGLGSTPRAPSTTAHTRSALVLLILFILAVVPWPGGAAAVAQRAGYRVVSVAGGSGQLSARLELAGDGGVKAELGPDVKRLSLTARQVRSSPTFVGCVFIRVLALEQRSLAYFPIHVTCDACFLNNHGLNSYFGETDIKWTYGRLIDQSFGAYN
jgi:hypothetical protein